MIRNINTKTKLLLFPLMFLIIVVISSVVYSHFSGKENSRTDIAMETDEFIQEVLKGRISVYQFLRTATPNNENIVIENIEFLKNSLAESSKSFINVKIHFLWYIWTTSNQAKARRYSIRYN